MTAIDLVRHLEGVDYRTACFILGCDEVRPQPIIKPKPKAAADENNNGALALDIWKESSAFAGTLAERYFENRQLRETYESLSSPNDVLRFNPRCPFDGGSHRCVVGLFRNIHTNAAMAIHRTKLGAGGVKIGKPMSLGPCSGAAIELSPDEDVELGLTVGEGLETALAGMALGFRPAWALGFAGAIRSFPVLGGIEALTILVDHDEADRNGRQAGQEAALACSERWTAAGREVRRVMPRRLGDDMADVDRGDRIKKDDTKGGYDVIIESPPPPQKKYRAFDQFGVILNEIGALLDEIEPINLLVPDHREERSEAVAHGPTSETHPRPACRYAEMVPGFRRSSAFCACMRTSSWPRRQVRSKSPAGTRSGNADPDGPASLARLRGHTRARP